jgi:hypothetical protein
MGREQTRSAGDENNVRGKYTMAIAHVTDGRAEKGNLADMIEMG